MSTTAASRQPEPPAASSIPADAPPEETTEQQLTVYLAKYGSLREEVFQRFQFQGQAFNFLLVVLTALLATGAAQFSARGDLFPVLILLVPLITGPFAFMYLAHDLMIFGILGYIRGDLSRDISRVVGRDIVLNDTRFQHLTPAGRFAHRILAPSRWLLFVFPTAIPVIYAAAFTTVWRTSPVSFLFALDCLVLLILLLALVASSREESSWRIRHGEPSPPPAPSR